MKLPDSIRWIEAPGREQLACLLSDQVASDLKQAIERTGSASLAVSGGSTPKPFFTALSQADLPWHKVRVLLVDDRCVPSDHAESNERLVRSELLVNKAADAQFLNLWPESIENVSESTSDCRNRELKGPITRVILGMGNDGHTASLFPCSEEIRAILTCQDDYRWVHPTTAPHTRVTLTPKRLLESQGRILHICGKDKRAVLEKALALNDPEAMPISLFLRAPITLFWAP